MRRRQLDAVLQEIETKAPALAQQTAECERLQEEARRFGTLYSALER